MSIWTPIRSQVYSVEFTTVYHLLIVKLVTTVDDPLYRMCTPVISESLFGKLQ